MGPNHVEEWRVRPAGIADLAAMEALAALTGGGFTNLPHDRDALAERLRWSDASYARAEDRPGDDVYILVLEHRVTGRIGGTACIFAGVGARYPFYSYKLTTLSMHSKELGRTFRTGVLHLVNDFDGASEVGGLFLHPDLRTGGLGRLLARSRYLFLARHRARFADRVVAELRGRMRDDGSSPVWDAIAGRFFGMGFEEADRFNAIHGNQFIADLMPRYPVYMALLPEEARLAIGEPHDAGRPARRLLEAEGFGFHGYVDIFDGGPTMDAPLDQIRTVREAVTGIVAGQAEGGEARLIAGGRLRSFQVAVVRAATRERPATGDALDIAAGSPFAAHEEVTHAWF
jgi:arginine N-succinyltransferase